MNLKTILTKMVPYINVAYAEHALLSLSADPNAKASVEHIDMLIKVTYLAKEKGCREMQATSEGPRVSGVDKGIHHLHGDQGGKEGRA